MADTGSTGNNPFAKLDKSRFPSKNEGASRKGNKTSTSVPAPRTAERSATMTDDDAELFLDAVRFIKPMTKDAARSPQERQRPSGLSMSEALEATPENASETASRSGPVRPEKSPSRAAPKAFSQASVCDNPENLADEENFFASAMGDVMPLDGKGRAVLPEAPPTPFALAPLPEDEDAWTFAVNANGGYLEGHLLGLDLMLVGKLQAGQFKPAAHLDLHGLTAQQAFHSLVHFIRSAYTKDQRAVLVVSGRGRNSPAGMGILREKLQEWLVQEPLRRVVLAFCSASPADGGFGALYVLLRRFRKDGRPVYWDRHPADPDLIWGTESS